MKLPGEYEKMWSDMNESERSDLILISLMMKKSGITINTSSDPYVDIETTQPNEDLTDTLVDVPTSIHPVIQGAAGEDKVKKLLSKYCLTDTSKKSKSGDMTIETPNGIIVLEIKNYTNKISEIQVNKFYRDIETNSYDAGLFISLNSTTTGYEKTVNASFYSYSGKRVPFIILNTSDPSIIDTSVELLKFILSSINQPKINIDKLVRDVEDVQSDLSQLRRAITDASSVQFRTASMITDAYTGIKLAAEPLYKKVKEISDIVDTENIAIQCSDDINHMIERYQIPANLKQAFIDIITMIPKMVNDNSSKPWSVTVAKLIYKPTGIGFKMAKKIYFVYPNINQDLCKEIIFDGKYDSKYENGILMITFDEDSAEKIFSMICDQIV